MMLAIKRMVVAFIVAGGTVICVPVRSVPDNQPCPSESQAEAVACDNGAVCSPACLSAVKAYRECILVKTKRQILGSPRHCLPLAPVAPEPAPSTGR